MRTFSPVLIFDLQHDVDGSRQPINEIEKRIDGDGFRMGSGLFYRGMLTVVDDLTAILGLPVAPVGSFRPKGLRPSVGGII